jgi:hypothetical protein
MPTNDKFQQFLTNLFASSNARGNRYEVQIIPPPSLYSVIPNMDYLLRLLTFTTETVEIPSQTVGTSESKINGLPVIPVASQFSFGNNLNITLNLSEDYRERNFLLLWQDLVYSGPGRSSNQGFNYYDDYIGQILVKPLKYYSGKNSESEQLDSNPAMSVIFRNCFPVAIQELSFNWGASNDKLTQGVTFSFFSAETQINDPRSQNKAYDLNNLFPLRPESNIPLLSRIGNIT